MLAKGAVDAAIEAAKTAGKLSDEGAKVAKAAVDRVSKTPTAEAATQAEDAGRKAKSAAATAFQSSEEVRRKAELADMAGESPWAQSQECQASLPSEQRRQAGMLWTQPRPAPRLLTQFTRKPSWLIWRVMRLLRRPHESCIS